MPRPEFTTHILNVAGIGKAKLIGEAFSRCLDEVEALTGREGREIAVTRTDMERACFFAKKQMANRPENQAGA